MSDVVIRANGLGKMYRVRHGRRERYTALRDVIASRVGGLFGKRSAVTAQSEVDEEFWALQDVSFEIKRGEVLGIIGRNGAGKSTLLKILSRITEPTVGRVELDGRVASLLEVGTGFHPELTGRENIYLNGAVLGMSRAEVSGKFHEIVAFAEVERFLDTPVKHFSSGMYVRLAFAVAAHLEPEILVVDEVLAVGDADFQARCLGKMAEVSRSGRTILFVSHNMDAIHRLCSAAIRLEAGRIVGAGVPSALISEYLRGSEGIQGEQRWLDPEMRPGNDVVRLVEVYAHDESGLKKNSFDVKHRVGISMVYEVLRDDVPLVDNFNVLNEQGLFLFAAHNVKSPFYNRKRQKGVYRSTAWIPPDLLAEGFCLVSAVIVSIAPFHIHFNVEQAISVQITDAMMGDSARGLLVGSFSGVIRPLLEWKVGLDTGQKNG